MKKITLLFAALFMVMITSAAVPETIYLKSSSSIWDQAGAWFWVHFWGNGDADVKMTAVEGESGVYSVAVPSGSTDCIFVRASDKSTTPGDWDGKWNQTDNLTLPTDGTNMYTVTGWNSGDGAWSTYTPSVVEPEPEPEITLPSTVYFVNVDGWSTVNIYTWTPEVGTWPGVAMTKEAEQIAGKDVYSYTVEKGTVFDGLNFNAGNDQPKTGDLTWTAGKYYVTDNWYTKEEAIAKLSGEVLTTWTVAGDSKVLFGTAWCTSCTDNDLVEGENGIWTKTYEDVILLAGTIQYKILKNHDWSGACGDENASNEDKNAELNIECNGIYDVTFTFDEETKVVSAEAKFISYPVAVENAVVSDVYVQNGTIVAEGEVEIFTVTGQNVTDMNGSLTRGAYIVRTATGVAKVMIK